MNERAKTTPEPCACGCGSLTTRRRRVSSGGVTSGPLPCRRGHDLPLSLAAETLVEIDVAALEAIAKATGLDVERIRATIQDLRESYGADWRSEVARAHWHGTRFIRCRDEERATTTVRIVRNRMTADPMIFPAV